MDKQSARDAVYGVDFCVGTMDSESGGHGSEQKKLLWKKGEGMDFVTDCRHRRKLSHYRQKIPKPWKKFSCLPKARYKAVLQEYSPYTLTFTIFRLFFVTGVTETSSPATRSTAWRRTRTRIESKLGRRGEESRERRRRHQNWQRKLRVSRSESQRMDSPRTLHYSWIRTSLGIAGKIMNAVGLCNDTSWHRY